MTLGEQVRHEHGVTAQHGNEIDVDDAQPLRQRNLLRLACGDHADVVHYDVHATVRVEYLV